MKKTDIKVLIASMRILSRDIQSQDGVANMAIAEAADRLDEFNDQLADQADLIRKLNEDISTLQSVVDAGTARVEAAEKQLMSLWDTGCDIQSEHGEVRLHVKGTSREDGERQALEVRGLTDYIKDMESKLAGHKAANAILEDEVEKLTKEVATLKAALISADEWIQQLEGHLQDEVDIGGFVGAAAQILLNEKPTQVAKEPIEGA